MQKLTLGIIESWIPPRLAGYHSCPRPGVNSPVTFSVLSLRPSSTVSFQKAWG
jgi:hypothetical protein